MSEIFVIGTLWFWMLIAVSVGLLTYLVNTGNGFGSTAIFVLTILAISFLGNSKLVSDIIGYVNLNPGIAIGLFCGYFIAGAIWSLVKWYYFVLEQRDIQLETSKSAYNKKNGFKFKVPKPGDYKGDIILWMSYWPLSFIWTMIDNPFKRIFAKIFKNLENTYTKISSHIFKGLSIETEDEDEN